LIEFQNILTKYLVVIVDSAVVVSVVIISFHSYFTDSRQKRQLKKLQWKKWLPENWAIGKIGNEK